MAAISRDDILLEPEQTESVPPKTDVELAFVMAPRQNLFFSELVAALRLESESLGARTSLHVGNFPAPRQDRVYVLVPPHEYFTLMHGRIGPPPEALRRTIFITAEQPGTSFFDANVALAPRGGALFDINRFAIQAYAGNGIKAHHFQLGWTQPWDHLSQRERDIDILFMGCVSDRRAKAIAQYARTFSRRRVHLVLSDNSRPNWTSSQSFHVGEAKWDLLGRSKILVNLHQDKYPYFEWLRIVQAMSSGAVVVSEHSIDFDPLEPGRHLLFGNADSLHLLAEMLLADGDRWWRIQTAAYKMVREQLRLQNSVRQLLAVGAQIAQAHTLPDGKDHFFTQPQPDPEKLPPFTDYARPPLPSGGNHNAAVVRRALKDLKLEQIDIRRRLTRIDFALSHGKQPASLEFVRRTHAYPAVNPCVSILMALYNYDEHVVDALDSAAISEDCPFEIVVVDDGSTDRSLVRVLEWMERHPNVAMTLLRHPVNRGLGPTRNSALGWARGEFCFVLDADNEIYPRCLTKLVQALRSNPTAVFSYGILERFRPGEAIGLMNTQGWEPERLRRGNYIDAMAMIRTKVLCDEFDGYTLDRRLHGWEDFDLWCRMAEAGCEAVLVPEVLARYRTAQHSMLSHTNISSTDAFSVIIEENPRLMARMEPPE